MEKNTRSTGNNPKASKGGLTSPKLYDSGLDFSESQSQKVEVTAIANQLHNCHTLLFEQSQVLQICLPSSVAKMSQLHNCHTYPHQWKMRVTPLQWKMTPPRELETTSGK
jgi:hypothetical protein